MNFLITTKPNEASNKYLNIKKDKICGNKIATFGKRKKYSCWPQNFLLHLQKKTSESKKSFEEENSQKDTMYNSKQKFNKGTMIWIKLWYNKISDM